MRISHDTARTFLSTHGWSAQLPTQMRSDLLKITSCVWLEPEQSLYHADGPAGSMFGLASGCIAFDGAQSENFIQKGYLGHPGMWFGFGMVAGANGRLTGARATRASTLLSVGLSDFRTFSDKHPDIWRQLLLLQIQITADVIGLVQDLMRRKSRERLEAVLARLSGLRLAHPPTPLIVDVTQSELAVIANLSRSSISPILLSMEQDGLIRLTRASIEILNPTKLLDAVDA